MYNVNNSTAIYLYDYSVGGYTHKFPTYDDTLKFVASCGVHLDWANNITNNRIIDNLNVTGNDTIVYRNPFSSNFETYLRSYMFVDDDDRVIDVRNDMKTIEYYYENGIFDYTDCWKPKRKHSRFYFGPTPTVEFRNGSVPYINSHHCHYGRNCSMMNEMRRNADPEMKEFVRAKRNKTHLSNILWDADWRSRCKSVSWKDCTKRRHQYKDKKNRNKEEE